MAGRRESPQREQTVRLKGGSVLIFPEAGEMSDFAEQLRAAIRDLGLTQYRMAKDLGIPQSVLSHFVNGRRDLHVAAFNKLAHYLGFQLVQDPDKAPRKQQPADG